MTNDCTDFTGFFWAGISFLCIIYCYFRIPEPRGRTFAELDLLFEQRVPARKFSSTEVDVFEEEVDLSTEEEYKGAMAAASKLD